MIKFRQILLLTSEANLMLKLRCQETVHTSNSGQCKEVTLPQRLVEIYGLSV